MSRGGTLWNHAVGPVGAGKEEGASCAEARPRSRGDATRQREAGAEGKRWGPVSCKGEGKEEERRRGVGGLPREQVDSGLS